MSTTKTAPVSPKVAGATLGGSVVAQFVLWALNAFVFGGSMYDNAPVAVPYAVAALVTGVIVFVAGYLPRDLASILFAAQNTEQPAALGTGTMGIATAQAPALEPHDADASDEQARDARGRFTADA